MPINKENRKTLPPRGPGKYNKSVKGTVLDVFLSLQDDPDVNLEAWAKREPNEFYKIAAKLIPTEVAGNIDSKITLSIVRGKTNPE